MTTLRERLDGVASLRAIASRGKGVIAGVPEGAAALLVWWLRETTGRSVVAIAADPELLFADLTTWTGGAGALGLFPAADTPPFDRVPPSEEVTRRRLGTLALLSDPAPAIVATSAHAIARPTLPPALVRGGETRLTRGARVDRDGFLRRLIDLGYKRVVAVSSPGDFAVRGGIVDVFGMDRARPWRAEWFGDEIDEIRAFEVETQTSIAKLETVAVWPARELDLREESVAAAVEAVRALKAGACRPEVREAWERDLGFLVDGSYDEGVDLFAPYLTAATLYDHLAPETLIVRIGGAERIQRAALHHIAEVEKVRDQEAVRGELPEDAITGLLSSDALTSLLESRPVIDIVRDAERSDTDLGWRGVDSFASRFDSFVAWLSEYRAGGGAVIIATRQSQRVEELVAEHGLDAVDAPDFDASAGVAGGALIAASADLSGGVVMENIGVAIATDHEIFGVTKRRGSPLARGARRALSTSSRGARQAASGKAAMQQFVMQFAPGDVVVHRDHGIGRFVEMRTVHDDDSGDQDYMTLEYAEGDKLYVPVAHLDRVDRYVGGADSNPTLSRLGTAEWDRTKKRVKERTEEVARELLGLYSRREAAEGHAFGIDSTWQRDLEASFPYQETPDQELVLEEIKRDMEASKPMDRVVCGDVGFGKTELALRAAFKAASEGKQVAVLVPTTVLSQQHFLTFSERLRAFPVTVAQLSRFCSEDEARTTIAGLKNGTVDIVVGTHRLLQRDIVFRNLGLVIVDEEQRFGVMQKERFKELRVGVDLLSLSATPIPRTLHMSLAGIRDLSVIQSPPEERQPIRTFVTAREEGLIREVITREVARGGQVFYVHNRVQSIEKEADDIRRLVPEARVGIGHGQMDEHLLAAVMTRFTEGDLDVLVATTIIESGLDIPNANTIIVNDAHRFGLAQLYQLRGRVGRSGNRAYAYLLYPPQKALTEKADKRLEVIGELQDLGAGFKLAMRDLEIRGAGNLLGEEQHGEIAAVGLEMYNHLLNSAVKALQGKPVTESPAHVTVSLPITTYLPPGYIGDEKLRLRCYQELAACADERELDQRAKGLVDRFGPMPPAGDGLIYSLRVRLLAAQCGALSVETNRDTVVIQMPGDHKLDLVAVAHQYRQWLTASPTRLLLADPKGERLQGTEWTDVLVRALRELGRLARAQQRVATTVS